MRVEEIDGLFSQFDDLKVPRVAVTGGEPFIREDALDILEKFSKYNFAKVVNFINTNKKTPYGRNHKVFETLLYKRY